MLYNIVYLVHGLCMSVIQFVVILHSQSQSVDSKTNRYLRHANYIANCMAFTKMPKYLKLAASSVRFKIGLRIQILYKRRNVQFHWELHFFAWAANCQELNWGRWTICCYILCIYFYITNIGIIYTFLYISRYHNVIYIHVLYKYIINVMCSNW